MLINKMREIRLEAFKNKESLKKDLLSTLISECCLKNKQPSDEECVSVIKKFIKNCNEIISYGTLNNIQNSVVKAELEIEILNSFLPKQMTEEALKNAIQKARNYGCKDIGSYMKFLSSNYQNFDKAIASKLIKEIL